MQPGPVSRNQAHSQPILPSHRSRYFHNGIADYRVSQNRSRLLHLPPRPSHSPVGFASSGRSTPVQVRPQSQPHPFFAQGPAAMGYIPQNAVRYSRPPGLQEPIIPLRTQFYDVSNVHERDRPTMNSQAQLKTSNNKSSSFKVVSNAAQLTSQYTADKMAEQRKSLVSQSLPLNKPAISKEKGLNKRSNDTDHETPAPPIKIRLVNRRADHSKASSQPLQPSQVLLETLKSDSTSGSLESITNAVGDVTRVEPSETRELSQSHEADQNIETKTSPATPVSTLEHSYRTFIDPSLCSHQDQSSTPEILSQPLVQGSLVSDMHMDSDAPISRVMKRSASQATTVSGTSTQPSCNVEDEDVPEERESFNPMSMIDETMILERDLSEIVNTRLQEGKPELLDTLYGEILIKMALKDEVLFEAVSKMLRS
ncbi:hypothetical protein F4679DRAFT_531865 [Xylaria curta]|nr:hypothetical protein F4679DRAFT_531865 [Xylaria curta]